MAQIPGRFREERVRWSWARVESIVSFRLIETIKRCAETVLNKAIIECSKITKCRNDTAAPDLIHNPTLGLALFEAS
jgi:hypothetical protein